MPLDAPNDQLVDRFGRSVTYLRLSVTDRCDLRCTYCMAERMTFVPKRELLSIEELAGLSDYFIQRGVRKLRLTGGEPLVRKGAMELFEKLSRHLRTGALDELTLTTNGTQLHTHADALARLGVRRVNVSLDTLDPQRYRTITRRGDLSKVLDGIEAALRSGLKVKLNAIISRGAFEGEIDELIHFAHRRDMDLTLIEEMPMGEIGRNRSDSFLPLDEMRSTLATRWTLTPLTDTTGGPARYVRVQETGGRLGFISPLSCNFCTNCNRVRLSATGKLYTCMGQEGAVDLRPALDHGTAALEKAVRQAIAAKPVGHDFSAQNLSRPSLLRHMSVLGG